MNHYEIFLIPVLMIADYYLTVAGYNLYQQTFGKHLVLENYELNPMWQSSVAKGKMFDWRHTLMIAVFTILFLVLDYYNVVSETIMSAVLGYYIILYGLINARHLDSICVFRYANKYPALLDGTVFINHELSIKMSQYRNISIFIPLSIIAIITRYPFAWGGAMSVIGLYITHRSWLKWYRINNTGVNIECDSPDGL